MSIDSVAHSLREWEARPLAPRVGHPTGPSRREVLRRAGLGFGLLALADLLGRDGALRADDRPANPLAARPPHFPPRARSVIYLFMHGGPSQVDTFDPKPVL